MAVEWTEKEKEKLFFTAWNFKDQIGDYTKIDHLSELTSKMLEHFSRSINSTSRDGKSILFKLNDFGVLSTGKDTYSKGVFHIKKIDALDFFTFKISPKYKHLPETTKDELLILYEKEALLTNNVKEICTNISDAIGLTHMRVKQELWDNNLIRVNRFLEHELITTKCEIKMNKDVCKKELSKEQKNYINKLREDVSYIYDSHSKNNPSITYSSDGTGTGKSYSVINSFIEKTDVQDISRGHRNLFFITPQKAQIDIDNNLIKIANEKGIKILSFLAYHDLADIDFKSWITGESNHTLFKRWIKELKTCGWLSDEIREFDKSVNDSEFYKKELPLLRKSGDFDSIIDYEKREENNNNKIRKSLFDISTKILQRKSDDGLTRPIKEVFDNALITKIPNKKYKYNLDYILSEIIDFYIPFERSKCSPCILLGTSAKFEYSGNIAVNNKTGDHKPVIKTFPFDFILGHKTDPRKDKDIKMADMNGKPYKDQIEFIDKEYFVIDEENYFRKNNISFTLIVDEEHIAYDRFFDSSEKALFDTKTNMAHVLSVVYRIVQYFDGATDPSNFALYDSFSKFVTELEYLFSNRCEISNNLNLRDILVLFSNNIDEVSIKDTDVEQIIGICKNVFSITPKRFFNEQALKNIKLGSTSNNTGCHIYFEKDNKSDSNPNMHDILQLMMCVFAACSHITDKHFIARIKSSYEDSQNSLLELFIKRAVRARLNVDSMFDRIENEDLYIDEFFTYFTTKVVFSIEKINYLTYHAKELTDKIFVTFRLDVFEELPEVTLIRILNKTKNSIICLSATSGFRDIYSGNYARDVMERYGCDNVKNLDYRSVYRTCDDAKKLEELRNARGEVRVVNINKFSDTEHNKITLARKNKDFSNEYSLWHKSLSGYFNTTNSHRIDELERQIEAMLLASYDNKNSLILSLSNQFKEVLNKFISSVNGKGFKKIKVLDNKNKIFEIQPFNNGVTLRVILFDATLAREIDVNRYLILNNDNTKIAFISSYKSAGTGLNLFINHENEGITEDFERLILINGPYYSNILTDKGLNSIKNFVLLLKHYSKESIDYKLTQFDTNLATGKNYQVLMREHFMSILKDIMQAIGRIERRDTYINTEIFLPKDLIDDIALQFSRLKKDGNDIIFQSMSLLNNKLVEYCLTEVERGSFDTEKNNDRFSSNVKKDGVQIDCFFERYLTSRLDDARSGDKEAIKLNEAIRSFDCIENPQAYVNRLLALKEIKNHDYFSDVIKSFYIVKEDELKDIVLCTNNDYEITDMARGEHKYSPYEFMLPKYNKSIQNACSTSAAILKAVFYKKPSLTWIPHPKMIPIFKGNIGEHLFGRCLREINVNPLTSMEVMDKLDPIVYELFDFFIINNGTLFCIDVKNWSSTFDKQEISEITHKKALRKKHQLDLISTVGNLDLMFVYVNTNIDVNSINKMQDFINGGNIYYMNLFKVLSNYYDPKKSTAKNNMELREKININPLLINILGGYFNG